MFFTYRGIPSYKLGIIVSKRPTYTVAAQQLSAYDTPGIDGLLVENEGKHSIVIQFDIIIEDYELLDEINEWLTGAGRFERSDYPGRYMNVEVQSGLINQFVGNGIYQTPISFYAYDPYWYATEDYYPLKNLIKSDFSDFTAYQGAVVTRNKTFPIDVFKGGRNLLSNQKIRVHGGWTKGEDGEIFTNSLAHRNAIEYASAWELKDGEEYTIQLEIKCDGEGMSFITYDFYINKSTVPKHKLKNITNEWQKMEVSFKYIKSTQTPILHLYFPIPITSVIRIRNQKITKGNNLNEPYSPAPEDGYGYTGSDGAYHIQTSGGNDSIKFLYGSNSDYLDNITKVDIKNFDERLRIRTNNPSQNDVIEVNQRINFVKNNNVKQIVFGNVGFVVGIDAPLDFIASDPRITSDIREPWVPIGTNIANNGDTDSKPTIKIPYKSSPTDITINGLRFIYYFQHTSSKEAIIDFNNNTVFEDGDPMDENLMIGYKKPTLHPGDNPVECNNAGVMITNTDRWV